MDTDEELEVPMAGVYIESNEVNNDPGPSETIFTRRIDGSYTFKQYHHLTKELLSCLYVDGEYAYYEDFIGGTWFRQNLKTNIRVTILPDQSKDVRTFPPLPPPPPPPAPPA